MSVTNVMLEAFMQRATSRQETLSKNVSNANTPGFIAQDVEMPKDFGQLIKSTSSNQTTNISITNPNHIVGSAPKHRFKTVIDKSGRFKPNRNNVDIKDQAIKASENMLLYETALKAYKASSDLVKTSISKGK
jgi:flagellar basal-body rod protein FlgB